MELAVSTSAPSRISVFAARFAIGAAGAALVLLLSLHGLSPEFSPAWRVVSEYANGQYSRVLSLMFAANGLSSLALALAIRSQVTTRSGKTGLVMLTVSGIGGASAALVDLNQAVLHDLAGVLGIMGLPIAAMSISLTLGRAGHWSAVRQPLVLTAKFDLGECGGVGWDVCPHDRHV